MEVNQTESKTNQEYTLQRHREQKGENATWHVEFVRQVVREQSTCEAGEYVQKAEDRSNVSRLRGVKFEFDLEDAANDVIDRELNAEGASVDKDHDNNGWVGEHAEGVDDGHYWGFVTFYVPDRFFLSLDRLNHNNRGHLLGDSLVFLAPFVFVHTSAPFLLQLRFFLCRVAPLQPVPLRCVRPKCQVKNG